MQRRAFCKLLAAAAASPRLPSSSSTANQAALWAELQTIREDYARFCATPAADRAFFEYRNAQLLREVLDESSWAVSPNSESGPARPPDLPVPGGSWNGVPMRPPIAGLAGDGPYEPTWESMLQYETPEWYRDAKFGIWAHWGPQCVPEDGDWYARNMYMQGSAQYEFHRSHYGPQAQFGFKDLCPQWTLAAWDPDALIERYQRAGAKFFLALANHHDNFDAWDSKHQPWNAVNIGPKRDVVDLWAKAARRRGLRFGVTVHSARNWWWMQTAHDADKTGPLAGLAYDGHLTKADGKGLWWEGYDPQQLYAPKHPPMALPDVSYVKNFYDRTRDLIDQHDPDLLYLDNALLPLGWGGMAASAYFYNHNLRTHAGRMEGVITTKQVPDRWARCLVADIERGISPHIMPYPWQSETCIGQWHYQRSLFEQPGQYGGYTPPREIIHWMADTVSKNGIFILNIPGRPDGTIDDKELAVLDGIEAWMKVNGEAIFATRPWTVSGEGPASSIASQQIDKPTPLGALDIRFTRSKAGTRLYAIAMGWPRNELRVQSLGRSAATNPGKVSHVELLGTQQKLHWQQTAECLRIELPLYLRPAVDCAVAFRISLA
jgi:alpha-L-fucosidase